MKRFIFLFACLLVLLSGCASQPGNTDSELGEKFQTISFDLIDGTYTRTVLQEENEYVEMFLPEQDSFIRILNGENDQEVYSYNYLTTEFTYIYYVEDEKVIKLVYNIGNDQVIEDEDDFIDLLKADAIRLQTYFESLIEEADISIDEL